MRRNRDERSLKAYSEFQGFRFGLFCILVIAFVTFAHSQPPQPQSPSRGANLGNSYAVGNFDTINTTNGNLMLNFPLGSLPAGRGSASAGIFLTYNSKLYNMRSEKTPDMRNVDAFFYKTLIEDDHKGGWRVGSMYSLEREDRRSTYGQYAPQCGYPGNPINDELTYVHKLRVIFPDGSTHEMIPNGYYDKVGDRYFNIDINGWQPSCTGSVTQTARPHYFSLDGTYIRLETTSENNWTLYFPDGSKVVTSAGNPQRVYDRNGNYVNLSPTEVSDQFGRSVSITTNSTNDIWSITSKGFGGEDVVWKIKWKNIGVSKTYEACLNNSSCPSEHWIKDVTEVFKVVDELERPEELGGSYKFNYNAADYDYSGPINPSYGWGEVSEIELPTGAKVKYKYTMDGNEGNVPFSSVKDILKNYPYEKKLEYTANYDGGSEAVTEKWLYNIGDMGNSVTAPDGGVTSTEFGRTETYSTNDHLPWDTGLALRSYTPDGTKTENLWQRNLPTQCTYAPPPCSNTGWPIYDKGDNSYIKATFTSLKDSNSNYPLTAIKEYAYDKNGNITEIKEYDWLPHSTIPRVDGYVSGLPANAHQYLKRITRTEYYNNTPDASSSTYNDPDSYIFVSNKRLLRLPKTITMLDKNEVIKSRGEVEYDYTNYEDSNTKAGNAVTSRTWDSTKAAVTNPLTDNNSVKTQTTYNNYGMPLTSIDANENITQIIYANVTVDGQSVTGPYPMQIKNAYGATIERTWTSVYDFSSGLIALSTDVDNSLTTEVEYDELGREIKSVTGLGTALESWTVTEYDDDARLIIIRSDLEAKGDGKKVSVQFFDQIGRLRLSKKLEDAATQSATNEIDGIKVQTRYKPSGPCTFNTAQTCSSQLNSNPYRAATSSAASSEETMGWTLSQTLNIGKHSEVETFSGGSLPAPWGSNTATTGAIKTDIELNTSTVFDQAGKKRRSVTNGLGQLIRVDEPNGSNELGTVSSPNQWTEYIYNTLGNLVTVNQGEQTRSFTYSSLSRLLTAQNPESGMLSYAYDNNGNLTQKSQPRSGSITVTTAYTYDELNRIKQRSYSGESGYTTPAVEYTYDNLPHAKGKLTKVSNSVSTTEYTGFDLLGRVTSHKQSTDGNDYTTSYVYNLSGALVEETYPTGRKIRNVFDGNGDPSIVQSRKNSTQGYWDYASNFTFTPAGAVSSMQLGNSHWESTDFNARLQSTRIALGTTPGATNLLQLDYSYGTTGNNGNVQSQTITVPTVGSDPGFTATQAYTYDPLSRLTQATETVPNQTGWQQTFLYDRYGNRRFDTSENRTTTQEALCPTAVCNPEVDTQNNRLVGYTFDAAGNTTEDAEARVFIYNAENKQVEVWEDSVAVGRYYYDGDGKRVKKESATETTIFIYDAVGKLITESSTQISKDPQVAYLTNDNLGTPRINTNAGGAVLARHDYHPFGEEISTSPRTSGSGYDPDDIRKKFTGYERDDETGLDFAQARYFDSTYGRFTSPDPIAGSCTNPQSHNKYLYVWNNPLVLTDQTGMVVDWDDSKKTIEDGEKEPRSSAQRRYENRIDEMINSKDKKTHQKGLKLQATYERLKNSKETFHVVKEDPTGASSGELSYRGQKGHLYVNLNGDSSAYGALTELQKLAHEFKHGEQFLNGDIGFQNVGTKEKPKWTGYRDDLPDEAEAWRAGFDAQSPDPAQRSGSTGQFVDSMARAYQSEGNDAMITALKNGPRGYRGRSETQQEMRFIRDVSKNENLYVIPKH